MTNVTDLDPTGWTTSDTFDVCPGVLVTQPDDARYVADCDCGSDA